MGDRGSAAARSGAAGVWAVVAAAGSGARFGAPKQFADLGGRPVLERAAAGAAAWAEGVVAVIPAGSARPPGLRDRLVDLVRPAAVRVVAGGASRSESVRRGLDAVPGDAEVVLVHDGARPLASADLYRRVVVAVRAGADAAVPTVPVSDSLRWRGSAVDRAEFAAVQTPQGFRAAALRAAHAAGASATDDATLVEAAGGRVVEVEGEPGNLKITTPADLQMAEALLDEPGPTAPGAGSGAGVGERPGGEGGLGAGERVGGEDGLPGLRVGHGFDIHRYSDDPGRALVLGGERFEGCRGLAGHSDADAVAHACIEALLGAAGLGDIGAMFPDSDPVLSGADSIGLLAEAAAAVRAAGWAPVNVDCSVVLDAPMLAPRLSAMRSRLSQAAGAPVTVSGRRSEGVGALGRGEGVAAWAVALVARR